MKQLITVPNTDLALIDYNVPETFIAELRQKHVVIQVNDSKDLAIVQKSITELTSIRSGIEKKRKELKADALEWGKKVDAEAKRATAIIEEIEAPFIKVKKEWNDEQERIKAEEAKKERERVEAIRGRIQDIINFPLKMIGIPPEELQKVLDNFTECGGKDAFDYQEFSDQANMAKVDTTIKLNTMIKERLELDSLREKNKIIEDKIITTSPPAPTPIVRDSLPIEEKRNLTIEKQPINHLVDALMVIQSLSSTKISNNFITTQLADASKLLEKINEVASEALIGENV